MSGSAASTTSPTTLQALAADVGEVVLRRVPGGVVEVDDVHGRHARAHERHMVVLDRRQLVREHPAVAQARRRRTRRRRPATAWTATRAGSPGRCRRSCRAGPAPSGSSACRPPAPPTRSGGCRRCCRCRPSPSSRASSPSRNSSSIVNSGCASLSTRASSSSGGRGRGAVVGADEPEVRRALGVVVAGQGDALGAAARNRGDHVHHRHVADRRLADEGLLARRRCPAALSSATM